MGQYQSLNVLSQKKRSDFMSDDAISEVANMINASGENRNQRRRLERSLRKIENIHNHVQKHLDRSSYKEYQTRLDENYVHFFCCLALTMGEKYKWKEDETHDQISSILESVDKTISKYANQNYSTDDLVELVDELYDIRLVADKH